MKNHFIWAEKYRPHTIEDCILPEPIKQMFQAFVDQGDVPNMILLGGPGMGKTTVAKAMCEQLDVDYVFIPASSPDTRGIDVLRNIQPFVSSVSFKGKRKVVILDEADNLTFDAQQALRNFIEQYSLNTSFILTANQQNKLHEAIRSRTPTIEFKNGSEGVAVLCVQFLRRVEDILAKEKIEYDKKTVATVIRDNFPDWRRILGMIQHASASGKFVATQTNQQADIVDLIQMIKVKDFGKFRQWAADNINADYATIYREFYDNVDKYFARTYIPELVLILARYMTQTSQVFDQEINFVAFCTEVMIGAEWKK